MHICNIKGRKVPVLPCNLTFLTISLLVGKDIFRTFARGNQKICTMGLGTYWARKDDQTGELKTVKPWDEQVSNGDKRFPDPHHGEQEEEETPQ